MKKNTKVIYKSKKCSFCFNPLTLIKNPIRTTYRKRNEYFCNEFCYENYDKTNNFNFDLEENLIEYIIIKITKKE